MRLLLGGSFDPVHCGHMRLALECQAQFADSTLAFIPNYRSPLKAQTHCQPEQRLAMLRLAVAELNRVTGGEAFSVEPYEIERAGSSYTYDTLAHIRASHPQDTLVWVMGMDSWASIAEWHRFSELPGLTSFLVAERPGTQATVPVPVAEFAAQLPPLNHREPATGALGFVATTPMWVSSSLVRTTLAEKRNAAFLVCEPVRAYIHQHHLYS